MKLFHKNTSKIVLRPRKTNSGIGWKVIISLFAVSVGGFLGMFWHYGFDPALLISLSFYQNLANPSVRIVKIQEGLRKEEIANIMAEKLSWTDDEKIEFVNAHLALNSVNLEGKYFPKTYLMPKDEDPIGATAVMLKEFSKQTKATSSKVLK